MRESKAGKGGMRDLGEASKGADRNDSMVVDQLQDLLACVTRGGGRDGGRRELVMEKDVQELTS
jgi:hypothetical protein